MALRQAAKEEESIVTRSKTTLAPVRLYAEQAARSGSPHGHLMPVVRVLWAEGSDEEKRRAYGAHAARFEMVSSIEDANWCVLPETWQAYDSPKALKRAKAFAKRAKEAGKLVLVWSGGDREPVVPIENAILFHCGLHRGLQRTPRFAFERPVFVEDYVEKFRGGTWEPLPKPEKPLVGFCGQAACSLSTRIKAKLKNQVRRVTYRLGQSPEVPVLHGFPVDLRAHALDLLEQDPDVDCRFILRERYRAGLSGQDEARKAADQSHIEFVDNILETPYTLCVRGGGNFSKRLYEVLACGRIPLLIDTDSMLPFEEFLDWEAHLVRVDYRDLDSIGQRLSAFHAALSPEAFEERQRSCRTLWLESLEVQAYYRSLGRYLPLTSPRQ